MTTIRAKFRPARAVMERAAPVDPGQPSAVQRRVGARAERLARQLALAHLIERRIEAGEVRSYGDVGRLLGLSQPRVTQVMSLLWLAPGLQEQILLDGPALGIRAATRAAKQAVWARQAP